MSNHQKMKAVGAYRYLALSDPESLVDLYIEKPIPTGHDLLVEGKSHLRQPCRLRRSGEKQL